MAFASRRWIWPINDPRIFIAILCGQFITSPCLGDDRNSIFRDQVTTTLYIKNVTGDLWREFRSAISAGKMSIFTVLGANIFYIRRIGSVRIAAWAMFLIVPKPKINDRGKLAPLTETPPTTAETTTNNAWRTNVIRPREKRPSESKKRARSREKSVDFLLHIGATQFEHAKTVLTLSCNRALV